MQFMSGILLLVSVLPVRAEWQSHTIDNSFSGADGVRLADINHDGLMDIATGFEEGNAVRVYLHPGVERVHETWPSVTVGQVASPEDAFFADLNGDGVYEVVSCAEGSGRAITVHALSPPGASILKEESWTSTVITPRRDLWMFGAPFPLSKNSPPLLVLGAKGEGASLTLAMSPDPIDSNTAWVFTPLHPLHWVMSIQVVDMDADLDPDILFSERRGERSGVYWLENRMGQANQNLEYTPPHTSFVAHALGAHVPEVMFLARGDVDGDGLEDIAVATREHGIHLFRRLDAHALRWEETVVELPEAAGAGKGIAIGDIDLDGQQDIVFSCEGAQGIHGVMWLSYDESPAEATWKAQSISGADGTKFDRIELLDLDGDGDLDVLTCEERENLGVIWYENPSRP